MPKNAILEGLPEDEQAILIASSTPVQLWQQQTLYRAQDRLEHVYFPQSGLVSRLATARNGRAIETGLIGREGLVGGEAVLSAGRAAVDIVVQISGDALRVPISVFRERCKASPVLGGLVNDHVAWIIFQAQQNALCHALHSIQARLCRWLLQASDAAGSSVLGISQEDFSRILGVQRTSLSTIARALQEQGGIRTRRGKIEILNPDELEQLACECYVGLDQRAPSLRRVKHRAWVSLSQARCP